MSLQLFFFNPQREKHFLKQKNHPTFFAGCEKKKARRWIQKKGEKKAAVTALRSEGCFERVKLTSEKKKARTCKTKAARIGLVFLQENWCHTFFGRSILFAMQIRMRDIPVLMEGNQEYFFFATDFAATFSVWWLLLGADPSGDFCKNLSSLHTGFIMYRYRYNNKNIF